MRDTERLLVRLGATKVAASRHKVYLLCGERFTLHHGSRGDPREQVTIRSKLRKLGFKV